MEAIALKDKDMVYREEGDESLIFDPATGSIKILNTTATFIWKQLKNNPQRASVLEALKKEYPNSSEDSLSKDLDAFVESLREMGLV